MARNLDSGLAERSDSPVQTVFELASHRSEMSSDKNNGSAQFTETSDVDSRNMEFDFGDSAGPQHADAL